MNRFSVIAYSGTFIFFPDYEYYTITSSESLGQLVERLVSEGFQDKETKEWIMPGAIMRIKVLPPT